MVSLGSAHPAVKVEVVQADYYSSSSAKSIENESNRSKVDDQFLSSVKSIKSGSGRSKVIRKSKSAKTHATEEISSTNIALEQCIPENTNALPEPTSDHKALHKKDVRHALSTCDVPARWGVRYEELASYVEEFSHARVPTRFAENLSLGNWVSTQRSYYKKFHEGNKSCSITKDRLNFKQYWV
mmetsp:Transcript_5893/g.7225  ORF Transcript_5893/g.7225 Transcript_5893/m.7225 type:complete len:184 (+) Transcript_5893:43-594(+)